MKEIDGQYVPLLHKLIDAPAWRALSHGARSLYVSLRRRKPRGRNIVFLSYRDAQAELRSSPRKIQEWFCELQHYGFIVLDQHGCLGVEGKGQSPRWRLTCSGTTSKTSPNGLPEPPSRDYLEWNGVKFKRTGDVRDASFIKTKSRYRRRKQTASDVGNTPVTDVGNGKTRKRFRRG